MSNPPNPLSVFSFSLVPICTTTPFSRLFRAYISETKETQKQEPPRINRARSPINPKAQTLSFPRHGRGKGGEESNRLVTVKTVGNSASVVDLCALDGAGVVDLDALDGAGVIVLGAGDGGGGDG